MQPAPRRYLAFFGLSMLGVLAVVWAYAALAPMAFMESGYPAWVAKSAMLRQCRLGRVSFFGDSRLEAGVIPAALPMAASNFGFAAGTAIEAHTAIRRALACAEPPQQAVIALVPEHFGPLDKYFWILSVRYGFLSPGEVWAAGSLARALDDRRSFATPTPDGLGGRVRDMLYALRFPSLSFASLVQGRVFGRYAGNVAHYQEILRVRGWADYQAGDLKQAEDAEAFEPTKLQVAEFESAIAELRRQGVEVLLLTMPFAQSAQEAPGVMQGYFAYLAGVARRFPGVRLLDDAAPVWPDRLFADDAHLDAEGARLFSARLAACVDDGRLRAGCDLAWRPGMAAQAGSAVLEVQQQGDRQH